MLARWRHSLRASPIAAKAAAACSAGAADPARVAYHAGLVACLGSGLVELLGAFIVDRVRRHVPRAALLSTLAGIALTTRARRPLPAA